MASAPSSQFSHVQGLKALEIPQDNLMFYKLNRARGWRSEMTRSYLWIFLVPTALVVAIKVLALDFDFTIMLGGDRLDRPTLEELKNRISLKLESV